MKRFEDLERENESLRERLSRLSEASLRINESLELDAVLHGVLDSARSLTGAHYGAITTQDGSGRVENFITSGLTTEEYEGLGQIPYGDKHFEYLRGIPEPMRIPDLAGHMRAQGLPELRLPMSVSPSMSFLAAPINHRGERVGHFYLADREDGGEFTPEDQETLVMFASESALVIINARRYREEQRARADLQALINISPVGVLVFDAATGVLESVNEEARRIVGGMRVPGRDLEQLLRVFSLRRADGREIPPDELPHVRALRTGETVRADEVVIHLPDGHSVTTLVNARPIYSAEGEAVSVVVTIQDITPLEELERLRAEFLGMVSHELRTPLATIKGSTTTLLSASGDLDLAEMTQFHRIIDEQADHMRDLIGDLLDVARIETGTLSVALAPAEVADIVDEARSRFVGTGGGEGLRIDLQPDLPAILADRRRIVQVLGNLMSNSARHSPDSSSIRVTAVQEDFHVVFSVSDDGNGISPERMPLLFRKLPPTGYDPGAGMEGSGLGLAICKGIVEAHGGRIWAESSGEGLGARFAFTMPVTQVVGPGPIAPAVPSRSAEKGRERILVVDDDPQMLRYVRNALSQAGYEPIVTGDPEEALRLVETRSPHMALLDLMLPGTDGIELMKDILDVAGMPVIFLSAYGREEIIARAFDMGATDYMVKPFSPTELAARIRAALRKQAAELVEPTEPYRLGDLAIDYAERRVTVAGRPLQLTALEYRLLAELSVNAGRILTYEQLLQRVWGPGHGGDLRPMRTVVTNLRRNLGDAAANPTYIFTEPRIGYRMPKGEAREKGTS